MLQPKAKALIALTGFCAHPVAAQRWVAAGVEGGRGVAYGA